MVNFSFLPDLQLNHIGFLVADIAKARRSFEEDFGYAAVSEVILDQEQTAEVQFLKHNSQSALLELITPWGEQSKLSNALRKGEGLHHLCYEVDDLEKWIQHLRDRKLLWVAPPAPGAAFDGRSITWFFHESQLLIELLASK